MGLWIKGYDSKRDDDKEIDGGMIGYAGSTEETDRLLIRLWSAIKRKLSRRNEDGKQR